MGHHLRMSPLGLLVMPEERFLAQVMAYAAMRGWKPWHDRATNAPRRCRECGSYQRIPRNDAGFPDLVIVRRPRVIVAELKAEGEKPTRLQRKWLDEFTACGIPAYIWVPSDWNTVKEVLL